MLRKYLQHLIGLSLPIYELFIIFSHRTAAESCQTQPLLSFMQTYFPHQSSTQRQNFIDSYQNFVQNRWLIYIAVVFVLVQLVVFPFNTRYIHKRILFYLVNFLSNMQYWFRANLFNIFKNSNLIVLWMYVGNFSLHLPLMMNLYPCGLFHIKSNTLRVVFVSTFFINLTFVVVFFVIYLMFLSKSVFKKHKTIILHSTN